MSIYKNYDCLFDLSPKFNFQCLGLDNGHFENKGKFDDYGVNPFELGSNQWKLREMNRSMYLRSK